MITEILDPQLVAMPCEHSWLTDAGLVIGTVMDTVL